MFVFSSVLLLNFKERGIVGRTCRAACPGAAEAGVAVTADSSRPIEEHPDRVCDTVPQRRGIPHR